MKVFFGGALVFALPCAAMGQIAVIKIKVVVCECAVHPLGAHVSHPLTVEVTDEIGKPVSGAAVSFQLPPEGPGGLFSNGLRTDLVLTDASGRASIHAMQLNRSGGPFRIRIAAVKELARAGAISTQYIGVARAAVANVASVASAANPAPASVSPPPAAPPPAAAKSGEITPTSVKMESGSHRKWKILAAVAAGAGAAFLGVSRAKSSQSGVSTSVVSIGTPSVTIGHP